MIAFSHYKDTINLGDRMCAPYHYFRYSDVELFDLKDDIPACDAVIYGGGAIEPLLRTNGIHHKVDALAKIAWGIGTSRRGRVNHGELVSDMDLIGVREFGREKGRARTFYVPCVSCMSEVFDKKFEETHDVVFYTHGHKEEFALDVPEGIPNINNREDSLENALAFIASGRVVVTNSFHGTYWALLLGKKVVCVPFSSKFYGFMCPPSYCLDGNWRAAAEKAVAYDEFLEDSRARNRDFDRRVRSLISLRRRNRATSTASVTQDLEGKAKAE